MERIAVLTSGGDAPGMNCALHAIAQMAHHHNIALFGILNGFEGAHAGWFEPLTLRDLIPYFNRAGTVLGTSRFARLRDPQVAQTIVTQLKQKKIEGLIVIGGEGSYKGALALTHHQFPVVCLPGSIDNDVPGTDYSVGFFSALECAVNAIDRLHDTAAAHQRIALLEVMGRTCSDLTVYAGMAGRCVDLILPETGFHRATLLGHLKTALSQGYRHLVVAVTEQLCDIHALAASIEGELNHETRATALGHVQRGGAPSAMDRIYAVQLGAFALQRLLLGAFSEAVGIVNHKLVAASLEKLFVSSSSTHDRSLCTLFYDFNRF